jgi:hypothetical protein
MAEDIVAEYRGGIGSVAHGAAERRVAVAGTNNQAAVDRIADGQAPRSPGSLLRRMGGRSAAPDEEAASRTRVVEPGQAELLGEPASRTSEGAADFEDE